MGGGELTRLSRAPALVPRLKKASLLQWHLINLLPLTRLHAQTCEKSTEGTGTQSNEVIMKTGYCDRNFRSQDAEGMSMGI